MNPSTVAVDYASLFWGCVSLTGVLSAFILAGLKWLAVQNMDALKGLEVKIDHLSNDKASRDELECIKEMQSAIAFLREDKVSRGELKEYFNILDKSILESGNMLRLSLQRVHERIDSIFENMYKTSK